MRARLRSVFEASVVAALAAGGQSTGCAESGSAPGGPGGPSPTVADFAAETCDQKQIVARLGDAKPAQPFDYVELRMSHVQHRPERSVAETSTAVASVGQPCASAPDVAVCTAALAQATATTGLFPRRARTPDALHLVVQSGATVRTITTRDELLAFLGPIDAPVEAMLVAASDGYEPLCDPGKARAIDGGYELLAKRNFGGCLNQYHGHRIVVTATELASKASVDLSDPGDGCDAAGRRPEGFQPARVAAKDQLCAYLERLRALEAASVPAFVRLARELAHHGAPGTLIHGALVAAGDEVRHAAAFTRLLERLGGAAAASELPVPETVRSLEALAIENVVEGCVRETFGALLARYQSEVAGDPQVRRLFASIAADETRHAELAWDVHAWLDARLDESARPRVRAAEVAAAAALASALAATEPDPALASRCGLPSRRAARVLLTGCAELWAA